MRKPVLFLLLILTFLPKTQALQNITIADSLLQKLSTEITPIHKLNLYNELAWHYQNKLKMYDSALYYANKALGMPPVVGSHNIRSSLWMRVCQSHFYLENLDSAAYAGKQSLQLADSTDNHYGRGRALRMIGRVYSGKNDLETALTYFYEALASYRLAGNAAKQRNVLNDMVSAYIGLNKPYEALDYLGIGIQLADSVNDFLGLGILYSDYAKISIEKLNNLQQGAKYFNLAKAAYMKAGKPGKHWGVLNYNILLNTINIVRENAGSIKALNIDSLLGVSETDDYANTLTYELIGMYYEAQDSLVQALQYFLYNIQSNPDKHGPETAARANANAAVIYAKLNQFDSAFIYTTKADSALAYINDPFIKYKSLKNIIALYELLNQQDSVKSKNQQLFPLSETLLKLAAETYEMDKEVSEILNSSQLLKLENQKTKAENQRLYIAIAALLILLFSLYWGSRQRNRRLVALNQIELERQQQKVRTANARLEGEAQERQRIGKDLHDRLGGMLAMVKANFGSFSQHIKPNGTDERSRLGTINELLTAATDEVRRISHNLHSGTLQKFGLEEALQELARNANKIKGFTMTVKCYGLIKNSIPSHEENVVYTTINEIFNNVLKHAKASTFTLQLFLREAELQIMAEDNGVGFNTAILNTPHQDQGLGLKSITQRVQEELGGQIEFDSSPGNGTTIIITIPNILGHDGTSE